MVIGSCQHLSSLKQIGKVNIDKNSDNPVLDFYMKLIEFEFGFESYTASILLISSYTTGSINATVRNNSLHCQITLKYKNKKCVTYWNKH